MYAALTRELSNEKLKGKKEKSKKTNDRLDVKAKIIIANKRNIKGRNNV